MIFTFVKAPTNDYPKESESKVTFEFEEVQIDSVVQHFEDFLRGCGFHFEGHLEFVEHGDSVGSNWWKGDPTCGGLKEDIEVTEEEETYWNVREKK
jgi:hypothetical protein